MRISASLGYVCMLSWRKKREKSLGKKNVFFTVSEMMT